MQSAAAAVFTRVHSLTKRAGSIAGARHANGGAKGPEVSHLYIGFHNKIYLTILEPKFAIRYLESGD